MPRLDGKPNGAERIRSPRQHISRDEAEAGVAFACDFVRLGCPVGVAKPAYDRRGEWAPNWGTGSTGYWLPKDWEHTPANLATLDRYRWGDALFLVTGHTLDVLDVDPRNGGDDDLATLDRYRWGDALFLVTGHTLDVLDVDPRNGGDDDLAELVRLGLIPTVYARAATPSGGEHQFIGHLGVRKTKRGGLDLQAGDDNGDGRGLVFIAPTVRRSKVDQVIRPYRWTQPLQSAVVGLPGDSADALVAWFKEAAPTTSTADRASWSGDTDDWLNAHASTAPVAPLVARAIQPFIDGEPFDGHSRMLKFQIHVVRLAAEGHNGVPEALTFARAVWMDTPHASDEDPAQEWDVALDHAIQNYGGTTK